MNSLGDHEPYGVYHCSSCGERYHEVRYDTYSPKKIPNGTFFRFLPLYGPGGENWTCFPMNDDSVMDAELICPGCGEVYCDIHGRTCWYDDFDKCWGFGPDAHWRMVRDYHGRVAESRNDLLDKDETQIEDPKERKRVKKQKADARKRAEARRQALEELNEQPEQETEQEAGNAGVAEGGPGEEAADIGSDSPEGVPGPSEDQERPAAGEGERADPGEGSEPGSVDDLELGGEAVSVEEKGRSKSEAES